MISTTTTASSLWAGLIAASSRNDQETRTLQDLLGDDAPILIVEPGELPHDAIRELISRRIVNVVAMTDREGLATVEPILSLASTLASFRRLVVLHDGTVNGVDYLLQHGVLILRDCDEVRQALLPAIQTCLDPRAHDSAAAEALPRLGLGRAGFSTAPMATPGSAAPAAR
ncbi:MAG: hypothetical protein WC718_11260 [Phycisphaerales bacterium]